MFLTSTRAGYNDKGEQVAHGLFLLVFGDREHNLRAVVRHVRLRQCGHWMMGSISVGKERVTLSGAYGSDGLPIDAEHYPAAWERAIPVPLDIQEAFWKGEGRWNSCGSEESIMRQWANDNLAILRDKKEKG